MGEPSLRHPTFSSSQEGTGQRDWEDWEKASDMEQGCNGGSGGNYELTSCPSIPLWFDSKKNITRKADFPLLLATGFVSGAGINLKCMLLRKAGKPSMTRELTKALIPRCLISHVFQSQYLPFPTGEIKAESTELGSSCTRKTSHYIKQQQE